MSVGQQLFMKKSLPDIKPLGKINKQYAPIAGGGETPSLWPQVFNYWDKDQKGVQGFH